MDNMFKLYFKNKNEYNNIYENRYNSENTIHFHFKIENDYAFFYYHNEIMNIIYNINKLDKEVSNILNMLPGIAREEYKKRSLIDEIFFTNEIEGVVSTRKEISEVIDDIESKAKEKNRIHSLVHKYLMLNTNDDNIMNLEDIRKTYDELVLAEIDKKDYPDGALFRKDLVYVKGRSEKILHTGVYPEEKINSILLEGLNILNDENIDLLVRVAIFHYIFSFVHPFYDGNGRTDRYISSLYLKKYYNSIISYRLSLTIKESINNYYEAFKMTNSKYNKGDITTFVFEFVNIVKTAFEKTINYLSQKRTLLGEKKNLLDELTVVKEEKINNELKNILYILMQVDIFGEYPINRVNLSNATNLSLPTLNKLLAILEEKELIIKIKKSKAFLYSINTEKFKG